MEHKKTAGVNGTTGKQASHNNNSEGHNQNKGKQAHSGSTTQDGRKNAKHEETKSEESSASRNR